MIDFSSEQFQRALQRIESEEFVWLTVVDNHGNPQPNPVWFIWQDNAFLIYSKPGAKRLQHIAANPRVALHFNADATGDEEIVIFTGRAEIDASIPAPDAVAPYLEKYQEGIARIGMTVESFSAQYTAGFRVYPKTLRAY